MATRNNPAAGVEVVGHLSILADDVPLHVELEGGAIKVLLPDLRTALGLRKRFSRRQRRAWTRLLQTTLASAGLELQVWVRRREVGRLAGKSRHGWLAALIGVDPLELRIGAILASLMSREASTFDASHRVDARSPKP
jgi:hypothetical protein